MMIHVHNTMYDNIKHMIYYHYYFKMMWKKKEVRINIFKYSPILHDTKSYNQLWQTIRTVSSYNQLCSKATDN